MKATNKQGKALALAFNSGVVRNMKPDEYKSYIVQLLALSLMTMRKNEGDEFVTGFIKEALASPIEFVAEQVSEH